MTLSPPTTQSYGIPSVRYRIRTNAFPRYGVRFRKDRLKRTQGWVDLAPSKSVRQRVREEESSATRNKAALYSSFGQDARTFPQPSPESMQRPPRWVIVGPAHQCVHLLLHGIGRPCRTHIINTSSGLSSKRGGSHLLAMPLKLSEANVSANFQTSSPTPAADGFCVLDFFCVCVSLFFMRVCVPLYVSFCVSLWSLRILTSGRKSVHIPIQALSLPLPNPPSPLPYRLPREIADRRLQNVRSPIAVH